RTRRGAGSAPAASPRTSAIWESLMKKETLAQLDQVFQKKQQIESAAAQAKSVQEQKEEEAVRKFDEIRESIIRPVMQQFVVYLGTKGHAAEIIVQEEKYEGSSSNQRLVPSSIKLLISPNSNPPQRYASHGQ